MKKHYDDFIQFKVHTRNQRFQPPQAHSADLTKPNQAPQAPNTTMKTNARNQYRGHGRGQ